jgi:hypothetical protein
MMFCVETADGVFVRASSPCTYQTEAVLSGQFVSRKSWPY